MKVPFALVTEGPTDQEVIINILCGFYKNKDLDSSILQPSRGIGLDDEPGGWTHLLYYLASQKFKDAFSSNEFIIVHFDADVCDEPLFGVEKNRDFNVLVPNVIDRLIDAIGREFYELVKDRIIFAICVDSIECWLLTIYFENMHSKRNKQTGCIATLNEVIQSQHGFYIDSKNLDYYRVMSKPYSKNTQLIKAGRMNDSLKLFLEALPDQSLLPIEDDE